MVCKRVSAGLAIATVVLSGCGATPGIEFEEAKPEIVLQSVKATSTTTGSFADEVYLKFSTGGRFPKEDYTINQGQTWTPNVSVDASKPGSISLYEADTYSGDDLIGTFHYNRSQPGTYKQTMTGDGSEYVLVWTVR